MMLLLKWAKWRVKGTVLMFNKCTDVLLTQNKCTQNRVLCNVL